MSKKSKKPTKKAKKELKKFSRLTKQKEILLDKNKKLKKELEETKDKLLRLAADFDNFRKKTDEERPEIEERAQIEFLMQLLPVFDNFERAYQHIPQKDKEKGWVKGIIAIEKLFHKILADLNIKKYHLKGKRFNPEEADAIMYVEDKHIPEGFIVEELEPGYKKNGKIIRHARVKVSQGARKQELGKRGDDENDN